MQPYELTISQQSILPLHTDENCLSMKLYFTVLLCCYMPVDFKLFFLSGFSFTNTDDSQDSRGREGSIFYSTLPLPPAHEH